MVKTGMIMGAAALSVGLVLALSGVVGPFSGTHALDAAWTAQPPLAHGPIIDALVADRPVR